MQMHVEIIGTESLGVRGLSCVVHTNDRRILIYPGLALGYQRRGLLPHPFQVSIGVAVRNRIIHYLKLATDVAVSHFHGDHIPLKDANPYQLSLKSVHELIKPLRLWVKGAEGERAHIAKRRDDLCAFLERPIEGCDGQTNGCLTFSEPLPHGKPNIHMGTVMMTRVEDGSEVFIHASDIQLLDDGQTRQILDWQPTMVFLSGPPLYRSLPKKAMAEARTRAKALAETAKICIIDHHLLRSEKGVQWLDALSRETKGRIICAADFMNKKRLFLEAIRPHLYELFPVSPGWHERYERGLVSVPPISDIGIKLYKSGLIYKAKSQTGEKDQAIPAI